MIETDHPAQLVRVAAVQFSTGCDVAANLATTLRMIDTAASESPDVMVLPEFCNHLSVYDDGDHAWDVAIDLDGPWVTEVGGRAAAHRCWIQLNCTVRRSGTSTSREPAPGRIANTNLVFSPEGRLVAANDKTVLMGAEGDFLSGAETPSDLVDTPFAVIGTYACMDGVVPEVPRSVAVRGATLLLNSLNSFALDEASLHVPVRAAENKAWVVACCKVGPLIPADRVAAFSAAMKVPADLLDGAGESQIVAPDGTVVAMGPRRGEAVVVADIDPSAALDKRRPDGTDVIARRRPSVYRALSSPTPALDEHPRAAELSAAAVGSLEAAKAAVARGAGLVVLPELVGDVETWRAIVAGSRAILVGSVELDGAHVGVAVNSLGVVGRQAQLHRVERHGWQRVLGDEIVPIDLPWGRLGVIVGDDLIYPEAVRLAALANCDVVAVPFAAQERWECRLGVVERAAENRLCVVAATAEVPKLDAAPILVDLPPDFTLWAPSRQRVFDGTINEPDVTWAVDGLAFGPIHPERAVNRQISRGTNLVDGRPWRLSAALTA